MKKIFLILVISAALFHSYEAQIIDKNAEPVAELKNETPKEFSTKNFCYNSPLNSVPSEVENFVYKTYLTQKGREKRLNIALVRPIDKLPERKRPAIIGIHSGGFLDTCLFEPCYKKYSENVLTEYFTPRGFITASIEYRLTNPFDFKPPRISEKVLRESQYKAVQDARAAIKYIFDNAEKLGVDTENVFLIGTSAGAITVLHSVFLDNEEVSKELKDEFGLLEKQQEIRGAISLAGAINDLKYLDGNKKIPLMLVHGNRDQIVPFDKGYYLGMNHLTPVYGGKAVFEELSKKGFAPKSLFESYGHSLPDRFKPAVFGEINEFIRRQLTCQNPVITAAKDSR